MKKTRKLSRKKEQNSEDEEDLEHLQSELRSHPEYTRVMDKLQQAKHEKLSRVQQWRDQERQSIQDWFIAQRKQAWDEFYYARLRIRAEMVQAIQAKMIRLHEETIASKQGGLSEDDADRDLTYARQPYHTHNTPHLEYSDHESKSTSDTVEEFDVYGYEEDRCQWNDRTKIP
ncbi:hypothetical protein EC973_001539 [Apophysomyces ossiformis]|uniref:Uncharacterized protein n=1 Tax=Apophysomyces ossiformis TaxID=679940 RepID=A0A8H7BPT9_9FUNG|nr:hypothetical protein EC973_001539 [Apophysomyces ossiformis]